MDGRFIGRRRTRAAPLLYEPPRRAMRWRRPLGIFGGGACRAVLCGWGLPGWAVCGRGLPGTVYLWIEIFMASFCGRGFRGRVVCGRGFPGRVVCGRGFPGVGCLRIGTSGDGLSMDRDFHGRFLRTGFRGGDALSLRGHGPLRRALPAAVSRPSRASQGCPSARCGGIVAAHCPKTADPPPRMRWPGPPFCETVAAPRRRGSLRPPSAARRGSDGAAYAPFPRRPAAPPLRGYAHDGHARQRRSHSALGEGRRAVADQA